MQKIKNINLTTGMNTQKDIDDAVKLINKYKKVNYSLLHCNSTYPAPLQDINLKYI